EAYHPDDGTNTAILGVEKDDFEERIWWIKGNNSCYMPHEYTVKQEKQFVTITCSCGFEMSDRDITLDRFVNIWKNGEKTCYDELKDNKEKEKARKYYVLYRTQDYAPAVFGFLGLLGTEDNADEAWHKADDVISKTFDVMQNVAEVGLAYAESENIPDFVPLKFMYYEHSETGFDYGETLAYILRKRGAMEKVDSNKFLQNASENVFNKITDSSKAVALAMTIARAAHYCNEMKNEDNLIRKSETLLDSIQLITGFSPVGGKYFDAMLDLLKDGLVVAEKMQEKEKEYYDYIDQIIETAETGEIISATAGNAGLTMNHVEQSGLGIFAQNAPAPMELIALVMERNYATLSDVDRRMVCIYLTNRLKYEFKSQFNITISEYLKYAK
ncbi:MAG: hypothetical protein MJ114_01620, partial [Acetatifactor sp.]|nr:hypothetical protein [Acetatifactor sp.]